ncbi:transposase, MuDR, MULE transposase domain protein [Tanacetum coccineum]
MANKKVVAHNITPKLQDNKRLLKRKYIQQDILSEYKINISYQQALIGKDYGIQQIRGSPYESFEMLSYYCHNLERKNQVTVTHIKTDEKGVFKMLFIAIGALIRTFLNCLRRLLIIDATHLKGLYKGTNLVDVGMDGNNQIMPIAFGIYKGETGPCWSWWMSVLKECIGDNLNLLFISDMHTAIALAVHNEFSLAFHAACCRHLMMNLSLKKKKTKGLFWKICKAYTPEEFASNISILQAVQPDAYHKLCEDGPQRWLRAHCLLVRYNYMTSNSVESVNAFSVINRKISVLKLVEKYRAMVQDWYYKRQELAEDYSLRFEGVTDWYQSQGYKEPVIMSSATSAITYTSVYTDSEPGKAFWGADDEEVSEGGIPRVIVLGYDGLLIQPVAPPSLDYIPGLENPQTPPVPQDEDEREPMFVQAHDPDYVLEPIYPEYIPLEDEHEFPAEEQLLPPTDSPTAESPGYVTESDPEEDPEEYEDDETEDGPVDYLMDGGDDGDDDDDSSRDDANDGDEDDKDEEEEEEEHLAPANSAIVIPVDEPVFPPEGTEPVIPPPSTDITIGARITVRP